MTAFSLNFEFWSLNFWRNIFSTSALECPAYFLGEQRTRLYERYCLGVAQVKNVLGAKRSFQAQTCFGLERSGA